MAIILADRYPGRAGGKTLDYPGGSFKNRTSPSSKDGTYLEQDWANDQLAFFQALMSDAGETANGTVDTARASQYFDALMAAVGNRFPLMMTFAQIDALTEDQGPIICTDMGGYLYLWTTSAYFEGYRSARCGLVYGGPWADPEPWEELLIGGVWSDSDPKQARLIAKFREKGRTVPVGDWLEGWGYISDLGGGDWKAPDYQNVFLRMSGTDRDTANAAGAGVYKADTFQGFAMLTTRASGAGPVALDMWGSSSGSGGMTKLISDGEHGEPRVGIETAPVHTRVAPVVLI